MCNNYYTPREQKCKNFKNGKFLYFMKQYFTKKKIKNVTSKFKTAHVHYSCVENKKKYLDNDTKPFCVVCRDNVVDKTVFCIFLKKHSSFQFFLLCQCLKSFEIFNLSPTFFTVS